MTIINNNTFPDRWKRALQIAQETSSSAIVDKWRKATVDMWKLYMLAGFPYGDSEEDMLKWYGEKYMNKRKENKA